MAEAGRNFRVDRGDLEGRDQFVNLICISQTVKNVIKLMRCRIYSKEI
jgi:hypothetical protein